MPLSGKQSLGAEDQGYFLEESTRKDLIDPVAVLETIATHPYEDLPLLINQVSLMPANMKRLYEDLLSGRVSYQAVLQLHHTVHRWLCIDSRAKLLKDRDL